MEKSWSPTLSFLWKHSLSLVSTAILATWVLLYIFSEPSTHLGSFFGNAIADWTGLVATVIATKFMYEKGSAESREPQDKGWFGIGKRLRDHSLTIFLAGTGVLWALLYAHMAAGGKWGQVVGNIVSEWTQLLGLLWLSKKLIEPDSKESAPGRSRSAVDGNRAPAEEPKVGRPKGVRLASHPDKRRPRP
jgi:hypothetical protein